MKLIKTSSIAFAALIIAACGSLKKSTTSAPSTAHVTTTVPATTESILMVKPNNGVFAPGNEELTAIQATYKDITMKALTDGHAIYTGVCANCHDPKSIYDRPEEIWPAIIDDMALRANITQAQKDAVYKYVLAIKATQPKEVK